MGQTKIKAPASELAKLYADGKSLQEIADMYGVTRERIRQKMVKAGFVVKDVKSCYKLGELAMNKSLADKVLLKATDEKMEELVKKARTAQHNLKLLKKTRSDMISSFKDTLFEIKGTLKIAQREPRNIDMVIEHLEKLVREELDNLNHYLIKYVKGE